MMLQLGHVTEIPLARVMDQDLKRGSSLHTCFNELVFEELFRA